MTYLRDTVQTVLANSELNDPRALALEVSREIPDERLREALELALIPYVSSSMSRARQGVPTNPRYAATRPVPSHKVAAVRDEWQKFLAERVQVDGSWKVVADCTVSDVETLAQYRRETAERNLAHAKRFEELAMKMRAQGASTVRDFNPA